MANFSITMIDARYYDGRKYADSYDVKAVGIKLTQGKAFVTENRKIAWNGAKANGYAILPFHYAQGPSSGEDPVACGKAQAKHFHDTYLEVGGDAELPPVIDIEDTYSWTVKGIKAVQCFQAILEETERLWGRTPLVYTAHWYWDSKIQPYLQGWKPWEKYLLWESDPDPDTVEPGGWTKATEVAIQYLIDASIPGVSFKVDFNRVDEDWFNKETGTSPTPPAPNTYTLIITGGAGVNVAPQELKLTIE